MCGVEQVSLIVIAMAAVLFVALTVQTIFGLRTIITDFLRGSQVTAQSFSYAPAC